MSAIVNQKDGYGWTSGATVTAAVASDKNGIYYKLVAGSLAADTATKTVYVDFATFAPQRIDKIITVNIVASTTTTDAVSVQTTAFTSVITGLLDNTPITTVHGAETDIPAGTNINGDIIDTIDIHVSGYAIEDFTIAFHTASTSNSLGVGGIVAEPRIYKMFESGI